MSRPSQLWPGDTMRRFFREIFDADPAVDAEASARLAEECTRRINRMLVWDAPRALPSEGEGQSAEAAPPPPAAEPPPAEPAFDPYAFSAVVVFARAGREALLERLAEIENVEHLRQLADAQHLVIDKRLKNPEAIRAAIVAGVEQRLADRRAAAS
jgi:hypothetical protein